MELRGEGCHWYWVCCRGEAGGGYGGVLLKSLERGRAVGFKCQSVDGVWGRSMQAYGLGFVVLKVCVGCSDGG